VRAIAPEVGGGFGAKINIYAEEYVCSAISKALGIPVKWNEDRSEAFVATTHGRDIIGYVDLAAKRDGTVLGLKIRLIADIGAYNMLLTAAIPTLTMMMANATYNIQAIRTTLTEVFTNKTPTDAYRGAGRPEATYFVERAMDMLARELEWSAMCGERISSSRISFRMRPRWARSTTRATTARRSIAHCRLRTGISSRKNVMPRARRDGWSASACRCTSKSADSVHRRRCRPEVGSTRR
jgi:CO/xanthine dehydrogenase Mo-binding subunit